MASATVNMLLSRLAKSCPYHCSIFLLKIMFDPQIDYFEHTFTGAIDVIVLRVRTDAPKRVADLRKRLKNRGMNHFPVAISDDGLKLGTDVLANVFLLHVHKPKTISDLSNAIHAMGEQTIIEGHVYVEFAVDVSLKNFDDLDDQAYIRHLAAVTWQRVSGLKKHSDNTRLYKHSGRPPTMVRKAISTPHHALSAGYQFAMGNRGKDDVYTHAYVKTYDTVSKKNLQKREWRSRLEIGVTGDILSSLITEDGSFKFERAAKYFNVHIIDENVMLTMKRAIAMTAMQFGAFSEEFAPTRSCGKKAHEDHNKKTRNALGNLSRDFNKGNSLQTLNLTTTQERPVARDH